MKDKKSLSRRGLSMVIWRLDHWVVTHLKLTRVNFYELENEGECPLKLEWVLHELSMSDPQVTTMNLPLRDWMISHSTHFSWGKEKLVSFSLFLVKLIHACNTAFYVRITFHLHIREDHTGLLAGTQQYTSSRYEK